MPTASRTKAEWCDFLEQHARKLYAQELFPGRSSARVLAQKIEAGKVLHGDLVRDIYANHHWAELKTASEVTAALEILESFGWVRIETVSTPGRPSERVLLHPDLRRD